MQTLQDDDDVFTSFCTSKDIDITKLSDGEKEKLQATTSYHLYLLSYRLKWIAKNFGVEIKNLKNVK